MTPQQSRIALFISNMSGAGAQGVMLGLAQGLARRGYPVDMVLARAEGPFLTRLPESVRVVNLNASRMVASLPALVRYLKREQPVAMLSAMNYVNIVALWAHRLARVPTRLVLSIHNPLTYDVQHAQTLRDRLLPPLIKRFYNWGDGIVAVSEGITADFAQATGIPVETIRVIYNPVILPELAEKAKAPLDHPWFEPGQPPVLLGVGRLTPQKDFPTLIRAFAQVRQSCPARLLILGEGRERTNLEALVKQLNLESEVSLPGFKDNPYAYMARAALFVLSSRWEGLGNVLVEAMYCGTPSVATDCPSGPREILKDGQYGSLVPVGNPTALAEAIKRALASQKQPPPPDSWQRFEMNVVVDQYLEVLLGR